MKGKETELNQKHSKYSSEEELIKAIVDRFLGWKLPEDFNPDAGISFKPDYNENSPFGPSKHEPVGTNLLTATQATEMIRYILEPLAPYINKEKAKAELNGVAWTIGVIDRMHIHIEPTLDATYKGIKNTIRDRYKAITGTDPAPKYPIEVQLTKDKEGL